MDTVTPCAERRPVVGGVRRSVYVFAGTAHRLRVRLLYRRFWPQVTEQKGWPDDELLVMEKILDLGDLIRR